MTSHKPDPPEPTHQVPQLPPRDPATHKGQAGHVAIVAGSRGMSGAAVLSGLGALRGGAGLVRIYCPACVQLTVAGAEPCFMTVPLPETEAGDVDPGRSPLADELDWAHVLAVGPGLGQSAGAAALVADTLQSASDVRSRLPVVIDADGLNNLAQTDIRNRGQNPKAPMWWSRRRERTVVTPHPGEMGRLRAAAGLAELRGDDDATRLRMAHEYASLTGLTVVLKGHRTVVATPTETYINTTGNAGMATGGMGDVLTGLIAALLAQGLSTYDAARLGVYAHGLAGDRCAKQIAAVGFLARDVAEALPGALVEASRSPMGFMQA